MVRGRDHIRTRDRTRVITRIVRALTRHQHTCMNIRIRPMHWRGALVLVVVLVVGLVIIIIIFFTVSAMSAVCTFVLLV